MRLAKVVKKETTEFLRDKGFILIMILEPLILILVFGYTFSSDINHFRTIVIDEDISNYSQQIVDSIDSSEYFAKVSFSGNLGQAKERLKSGDVRIIFYIPEDFGDKLQNATQSEVYVFIDSSDYTVYNIIKGASGQVLKDSLEGIVQLIVRDLESQRDSNQKKVDEIQGLLDEMNEKGDKASDYMEDIKIQDSIYALDDLRNVLNQLKLANPNITSIDPILNNIREMRVELVDYKEKTEDIDEISDELKQSYEDIQDRMDIINLELKTLKKEFLSSPIKVNTAYEYGEITYFEYLLPACLTLVLFFLGVVQTTTNLVDERMNKTLFRISTTPLKKWELLGGKFFVFFIIGMIDAIYVLVLALFLFNAHIAGSIWDAFLVLTLVMSTSIGLGLLASTILKTTRQTVVLLPLIMVPAIFLSQTFSPIEVMPKFMQYVSYISPMFYSNVALREIMIKGSGISVVWPQMLVLAFYTIVTTLVGIWISKKRIQ